MEPKKHPHQVLQALADAQHGVVARQQLLAAGMGAEAVKARLRTGNLVALHDGVYAVAHRALRPQAQWIAAVLAAGPGTVLSHRSAARLWGMRPWSGAVEVTVPHGAAQRRAAGVRIRQSRRLAHSETTLEDGIPVTTVARTLLDLAAVVPPHHVRRAVERADQLELFDLVEVERVLAAHPRRKGRRALVALLDDARRHDLPHTRSDLEAAMLQLCLDHGLPRPYVNRYDDDREVDFRWPEHHLVVEVDGWSTHRTRRAFAEDRARDRVALRRGHRVARFTWTEVMNRPQQVAAELRDLLVTGLPTTRMPLGFS